MAPSSDARHAAERLAGWAAEHQWRGADPYDGLWWRWPAPLTSTRRLRQLVVQAHVRSPVDLRRFRTQSRPLIPKTLGLFLGVEASLTTGGDRTRVRSEEIIARLGPGMAWGYPFDVQTRWSFYPAGSPNIVVTSFVSRGLAAAGGAFNIAPWRDRASRAAGWILERLHSPGGYFAYHEHSNELVHNASVLGAATVWEHHSEDPAARQAVTGAVERTLAAQRPDGSWPYGAAANLTWVDSLHTGYVLSCLCRMQAVDPRVREALVRGAEYYTNTCFRPDGAALLGPHSSVEDGHSAGTALSALAACKAAGVNDANISEAIAHRLIDQIKQFGHPVFRTHRSHHNKIRYVRWCDAHVAAGLVDHAAGG